jgi:serine/threonine protein kinase
MDSQFLGARYQIEQELGRKAGRKTLLCIDQATGELVVVKLLAFNSDFEWDDLKLFEREAEALKSLSHPAIPRHLDYFEVNSSELKGFALVQSYIAAQSLSHHVNAGRIFTETDVKEIAQAILEILVYLHRQNPPLIHRDIKPSNILLGDRSGNSVGKVYLVDFGSVQTVAAQEGATRTIVGTYGYMPPEQFGGRTVPASDLYSLGATLIYLLTGTHPADLPQKDFCIQFEQETDINLALGNWLQRMCEPNLERRFSSAYQALQAMSQNYNLLVSDHSGKGGEILEVNLADRFKFRKSNEVLEVFVLPVPFDFLNLLFQLFIISVFSGAGVLMLYSSFAALNITYFFIPILLFVYLYFTSDYFVGRTLYLSQEEILFTQSLFGYFRFNLAPPSLREDIVKLVYFPEFIEYRETAQGSSKYPVTVGAQLEIWAGVYHYKFPGAKATLPERELQWLAKELSIWLSVPILYADTQPSESV